MSKKLNLTKILIDESEKKKSFLLNLFILFEGNKNHEKFLGCTRDGEFLYIQYVFIFAIFMLEKKELF